MIAFARRQLINAVMAASKRGNPLACWVVERQVRKAFDAAPVKSPIAYGQFMIPDLSRPLPDDDEDGMPGELEWVPFERAPVAANDLMGQRVQDMSTLLGSYGLGGYGFFGLLLDDQWLIVPILGASEWISLDGRILGGPAGSDTDSWIRDGDDTALLRRLQGARISRAELRPHGLTIGLDNGAVLEIDDNPKARARFVGTGKPRVFLPGDDLSKAVFLSPSGELFL